jgi:hypothetical protein
MNMDANIKNRVNFNELFFWKSFLRVLVLFFVIKLIFKLVSAAAVVGVGMSSGYYFTALSSTFFSSFPLAPIFSFAVTYFVVRRLINDDPRKVLTVGFAKLCIAFLAIQVLVGMVSLIAIGGELGIFIFSMIMYGTIPIPVLFLWIFLSTLWLYKSSYKKELPASFQAT